MSISLTVMTFNLHRDSPTVGPSSRPWESRKSMCAELVSKHKPVILCTQEGIKSQVDDLASLLPGYQQFGMSKKGSSDPADEHCAIFYDKSKVERVEGGTFWLSESPALPASTSWGADIPSIATWVTFQLIGLQDPGFTFQVSIYSPSPITNCNNILSMYYVLAHCIQSCMFQLHDLHMNPTSASVWHTRNGNNNIQSNRVSL